MTKSRFQSPNLTPLGLNIWPLKGFTQEGEITSVGATFTSAHSRDYHFVITYKQNEY